MFELIKKAVKGVKYRMFPITTIAEAIGVTLATSTTMDIEISKWLAMFKQRDGLNLPSAIASELARLSTIECVIDVSGSARANYISSQLAPVRDALRNYTELGIAGGGLIFKPYIDSKGVCVSYVKADSCYPVAFNSSGKLDAVVFLEQITRNNLIYTRLEYHHLEPQGCVIENKAFMTSAVRGHGTLGEPIALSQVDEWAKLEPHILIENTDRLLLGYFKMPIANTIELTSPLGVSGYSRATSLITQANEQWARIMWEYEGSELVIHAYEGLFKTVDGTTVLPKGKERQYRLIRGDIDDANKMTTHSPTIRDISQFNGLNNILKRIEFTCGLAYGTLSDPQNIDKTAEEIKASKQRSYALVKDIQKSLQSALDDLIYAMDIWVSLADLAPIGAYVATYEWDDSIIADPNERKKLYWQYVQAGKYPFWRYLMEFEQHTEKQAKEIVAETQSNLGDMYAAT